MITKLSIIIPAYNEGSTIHLILDKIREVILDGGIGKEIIIVNDCSTDDTESAVLRYMNANPDMDIRYHRHEVNMGKGASLHTGISMATGEYTVIQDADLEYDPQEYNDLLKPVLKGFADVVYGSRFMGGNPHRILFFWHTMGNRFLTTMSNMFTNLNLTDMETCYKLFDTKMLQSLKLKEKRFGFEPEVTGKISRIPKIRIYEVGISYYGRTYEDGKKIGWKDGLRALYCIFRYNAPYQKISLQFLIYLIIGGVSALFNLLLFLLLIKTMSIGVSTVIAFYSAAVLNYILCVNFLFNKNARWKGWREYLIYLLSITIIAAIDLGSTKGFINMGLAPVYSKTIATAIGLALNFLIRKYLIFKDNRQN